MFLYGRLFILIVYWYKSEKGLNDKNKRNVYNIKHIGLETPGCVSYALDLRMRDVSKKLFKGSGLLPFEWKCVSDSPKCVRL